MKTFIFILILATVVCVIGERNQDFRKLYNVDDYCRRIIYYQLKRICPGQRLFINRYPNTRNVLEYFSSLRCLEGGSWKRCCDDRCTEEFLKNCFCVYFSIYESIEVLTVRPD